MCIPKPRNPQAATRNATRRNAVCCVAPRFYRDFAHVCARDESEVPASSRNVKIMKLNVWCNYLMANVSLPLQPSSAKGCVQSGVR